MSTRPIPAMIGRLEIRSAVNDRIDWHEDDGVGGTADLNVTATAGWYYPDDLASHVSTLMTNESIASGLGVSYTMSFQYVTGRFNLEVSAGTFYPKLTSSESAKLLTGGDGDSFAQTLLAGQYGFSHCGYAVDSSYPSLAADHGSDVMIANYWTPVDPIGNDPSPVSRDTERSYRATTVEAFALDGSSVTYNFSPWRIDKDDPEFPNWGGNWQRRQLSFELLRQGDRDQWINWFWGPFGSQGEEFRLAVDRLSPSSYQTVRLTGDSLPSAWLGDRLAGYSYWSHVVNLARADI